jgi:hypothetical protein
MVPAMAKLPPPGDSRPPNPAIQVNLVNLTRYLLLGGVLFQIFLVWADYYINYSYGSELGPIRRLFNITREDGLASWFSETLLFLTAMTLWFLFAISDPSRRATRTGWMLVALFFTYMAIDDGAEIHERMGSAFKAIQEDARETGEAITLAGRLQASFPSYEWQLLFVPGLAVIGAFVVAFLLCHVQGWGNRLIILTAFALMALCVGLDFIEGLDPDHPWNAYTQLNIRFQLDPFTVPRFREVGYETLRHFSKSLEEFLEMLSTLLLLTTLIRQAGHVWGDRAIRQKS